VSLNRKGDTSVRNRSTDNKLEGERKKNTSMVLLVLEAQDKEDREIIIRVINTSGYVFWRREKREGRRIEILSGVDKRGRQKKRKNVTAYPGKKLRGGKGGEWE